MRVTILAAGALMMACPQNSAPPGTAVDVAAGVPADPAAPASAVADPLEVSITYCIP